MKTLRKVLLILVLLNVAAGAVGAAWLVASGRVSRDRVHAAVDLFRLTIQEQAQRDQEAEALRLEAEKKARDLARLEAVKDGPVTIYDRLEAQQQGNQLALQRVESVQRGVRNLKRQLDLTKQMLADERAAFDEKVKAFEQTRDEQMALAQDENFKQAVGMYEGVQPKQAKQMFQALIDQGQVGDVVRYLAAMQPRKAAAVLKQFKSGPEIATAADLVQRLRERGIEPPMDGAEPMDQPKAPGANS